MGCSVSNIEVKNKSCSVTEDGDLKLSSCKVIFSPRQLLKLNQKFLNFIQDDCNTEKQKESQTSYIREVVERLIQRLICNVGNLDPRFSSKFLINLEPLKNFGRENKKSLKLKYLVRLDIVSTPALYPESFEPPIRVIEGTDNEFLPQGYAKVRVHGEFLEEWMGFISPNGYLRRDKIQKRFVELLARAAARPTEPLSPDQVDESRLCGSPGKIIDPITLHHILRVPPSNQVFFGPAECNESRFPDPRDFRIAIVEGVPDTRLHISFLSPTAQSIATDVEISITLAIGVSGWPAGSSFPFRLPLDHVDVVLAYKAAQMHDCILFLGFYSDNNKLKCPTLGSGNKHSLCLFTVNASSWYTSEEFRTSLRTEDHYLVPKGPPSSVQCEDRCSVWEIRTLTTEMFLEHHYCPTSVVCRIFKTLVYLLDMLKARGVKTINRYILKNLLFFELEQKKKIQHWAPKMISRRVLSILDQLLVFLRNQMIPSYIFTGKNLLLQDEVLDEDYISDGDILEIYLKQLFYDGYKPELDDIESVLVKDQLENVMVQKWENVIASMLPSMSNRSSRLSVVNNSPASISYTRQQLEYVSVLLREILKLKNLQRRNSINEAIQIPIDDGCSNKEDFLYLLQIMFAQAKQKLISSTLNRTKRMSSRNAAKLDQILLSFDISTSMLIDDIRRSKGNDFHFVDDTSIVIKIMECLYKAIDSDGRVLGPILRPYLNQIFKGSHENCWFLFDWKKTTDFSEFQAIGAFSNLVLSKAIEPADGIINSATKGWSWAKKCLPIMTAIMEKNSTQIIIGEKIDSSNSGLRLIFSPSPGKTIRFNASTKSGSLSYERKALENISNGIMNEKCNSDSRFNTIKSFQEVLNTAISSENIDRDVDCYKSKEFNQFKNLKLRHDRHPHTQLKENSPFTVASMETRRQGNHRGLGSIVQALISLQKLSVLQEISQYLPENERSRILGDIKKLSKEIQRLAVENYRKNKNLQFSPGRNRFSFKKSSSTLPPRLNHQKFTSAMRGRKKATEIQGDGVFRKVHEFSKIERKDEDKIEAKPQQKPSAKEESLLGTCRQLRKDYHPSIFEPKTLSTLSKTERYKRGSSTFPKSIINTPFYIKVSSCKSQESGVENNRN